MYCEGKSYYNFSAVVLFWASCCRLVLSGLIGIVSAWVDVLAKGPLLDKALVGAGPLKQRTHLRPLPIWP